jgi:hypothetical protein
LTRSEDYLIFIFVNVIMYKGGSVVSDGKSNVLKILATLSVMAFIAVVAVNGLANALPLNGVNTGVLSDEIPNLFVPTGLTFSIWGLIYLLLAGYSYAILRESFGKKPAAWTESDAWLFLANMAANIGWIFAWHWRMVGLAMAIMLIILATLIALEQSSQKKLATGGILDLAPRWGGSSAKGGAGRGRAVLLTLPIRVYLGWISVATIANATAVLVKAGWNGFGLPPELWTVLVILAGLVVALGFSVVKRQFAAPLVVVWAYLGIVLKRAQVGDGPSMTVLAAAAIAGLIIIASFGYGRISCPFRPKKA